MSDLVAVGYVSKIFGNGLSVTLYDTFPKLPNMEEPLFVVIDKLEVPLFLKSFQRKGRAGAVIEFDDFDTVVRMGELVGMELYAKEHVSLVDELGDDELYFEDLVGWHAILKEGVEGEIVDYIENDNSLFEIEVSGSSVYIPANEDFIVEIDEQHRIIEFTLPQGLLELYIQ